MSHAILAARARVIALRAACESKRPVSAWPGDEGLFTAAELPDVSRDYIDENPVTRTRTLKPRDTVEVEPGHRYGKIMQSYSVGSGLEILIGEWI